jgi:hypothetical protein
MSDPVEAGNVAQSRFIHEPQPSESCKPMKTKAPVNIILLSMLVSFLTAACVVGLAYYLFPKKAETVKPDNDYAAALETRIARMENQVKDVQSKMGSSVFTLKPESKQYQAIFLQNGLFLVSQSKIVPYLKGYKIYLSIGNVNYAKYSGANLKISDHYGEDPAAEKQLIKKSFDEKTIEIKNVLMPGSWNTIEIKLTPLNKKELSYLRMEFDMNVISLIQR